MSPFEYDEASLQGFYNLKDLNPSDSWKQDSIVQFDLSKWSNQLGNFTSLDKSTNEKITNDEGLIDIDTSSYEILKDLIQQQQIINNKINDREMQSYDSMENNWENIRDPLNNNQLMKNIIPSQFNSDQSVKQYLINQKEFDVKKFLRDIHSKDTFEDLTRSLDQLDYDIKSQSSHLQVLVENNFTKYVKIKNRLDSIYKQFSESSSNHPNEQQPTSLRNTRNNKLNKTVDIHVDELNEKVNESVRATNLKLKPLLDASSKINKYTLAKQFIEANKDYFNLPRRLNRFLYANDYKNFILEYNKGYDLCEQLKAEYASDSREQNKNKNKSDKILEAQQPKIIEVIWVQVEKISKSYRKQIWDKLVNVNNINSTEIDINRDARNSSVYGNGNKRFNTLDDDLTDENDFLPLISRLLDLKIERNPIPDLLNTHLDNFENEITTVTKNSMEKIITMEKNINKMIVSSRDHDVSIEDNNGVDLSYYTLINKIFNGNSFSNKNKSGSLSGSLSHIHSLNATSEYLDVSNISDGNKISTSPDLSAENSDILSSVLTDTPVIIEMWLLILKYINDLGRIANKFVDTWEHVDKFLSNTYQRILENDKRKNNILVGDNSKKVSEINIEEFLQLSDEEVEIIHSKGERIIKLLCNNLLAFFQSSQESLLTNSKNMNKDSGTPSDYGFIPPRANGLSCLRYLPMILDPLLKYTNNMAQLNVSPSINDSIKHLVTTVIDRFVGALSSTKLRDISRFYLLEDWEVNTKIQETLSNSNDSSLNYSSSQDKDSEYYEYGVTHLPDIVLGFQQFSIQTIRDILFSYERLPSINNIRIVDPPSRQLLVGVEIQQIISLEAVLEAILKNAAKDKDNPRNIHTLLTLTNLQYIKEITFPETIQYFDEMFEWDLKSKPLEIFKLLNKMESSIFGNYLSDLKIHLRDILESKFHQIDWPSYTSNSFRVGDYIVETLMLLVTIHSECFKIGPQLINEILKEAQLFIARYLFEAFKPYIGKISADGLLQLCVDITFFQEVLNNLLEPDTRATLRACLQNCFQNKVERLEKCIIDIEPIVQSNLKRTEVQFAAFK